MTSVIGAFNSSTCGSDSGCEQDGHAAWTLERWVQLSGKKDRLVVSSLEPEMLKLSGKSGEGEKYSQNGIFSVLNC
jgi:hypothetical protein